MNSKDFYERNKGPVTETMERGLKQSTRRKPTPRERQIAQILYDIHRLEAEGEVMMHLSAWLRKIQGR